MTNYWSPCRNLPEGVFHASSIVARGFPSANGQDYFIGIRATQFYPFPRNLNKPKLGIILVEDPLQSLEIGNEVRRACFTSKVESCASLSFSGRRITADEE